jgi:L-ascorbate metabolism protein UlaG (beta-lactamase superfamily)
MNIRWYGHACFGINIDKITIVTDPHDGKSIGIKPPQVKADIVLVSHSHFDHDSVKTVRKLTTKVIFDAPGRGVDRSNIRFRSIPVYHDNSEGAKRGVNNIFYFNPENVKFCHLGDLGHIINDDQIKKIGEVDILFIPVGGVFTIDADDAWKVIEKIKPKVVIPMHYRIGGLSLSIQPLEPFLNGHERVEKVGNEIEFDPEDLPDELEVWVFTL